MQCVLRRENIILKELSIGIYSRYLIRGRPKQLKIRNNYLRSTIQKRFSTSSQEDPNTKKYIPENNCGLSIENEEILVYQVKKNVKPIIMIGIGVLTPIWGISTYFMCTALIKSAYLKGAFWMLPTYFLASALFAFWRNPRKMLYSLHLRQNGTHVRTQFGAINPVVTVIPIRSFRKCDDKTFKIYAKIATKASHQFFPFFIDNQINFIDSSGLIVDRDLLAAITNGLEIEMTHIIINNQLKQQEKQEKKSEEVAEASNEKVIDV